MAPYEALYGRKCCTLLCWTELGEHRVLGPELVFETEDKVRLIRDCLKAAFDRQKSIADLKKHEIEYSSNPSYVVSVEEIEVRPDLTFEEDSAQILNRDVKVLMRKFIPLVKVLWQNLGSKKAIWEPEDSMRWQYPHLFRSGNP
ncbi:uncharacterized protein LOC128290605 [Gossypium arboreum]|uniref:uncharacterized protein LOC128290605 n=1 Tax=Gossypium arboreum TaxID=29729 RepID=UPI0022F18579|nr:uncharacterized protein LOC128290605 [Gossypium arboreum]